MNTRLRFTTIGLLAFGALFLILLGCTTDSPTEPGQDPLEFTDVTGGWVITITASSNRMETGGDSVKFTVTIANRETGAPPPDRSTAIVSTSMGLIDDPDEGLDVVAFEVFGGALGFELFSDDEEGTATVEVSFQNSRARRNINVVKEIFLFLESVSPTASGKQGGITATIEGQGFAEPLRVEFGGILAEVLSVSATRVRVVVPAYLGDLFEGEFDVVDVDVSLFGPDGSGGNAQTASDSLPGAFTYIGSGEPESPGECGDGSLDEDEDCDDGNPFLGDGCRADCTFEICGDGTLDPQEECDDNNLLPGDGCDANCFIEP